MTVKRNEGEMTGGMLLFIFLVGGPLYLAFEKPVIFWLVFLPIAILVIALIVKKLSNTKNGRR